MPDRSERNVYKSENEQHLQQVLCENDEDTWGINMKTTSTKVVIIGAGMVGSATAFCLTVQGVCAEIIIIDQNKEKALGEAQDLQHSIEYLNRNVRISAGDYSDCQNADVVVITASIPITGIKSRVEMLDKNIGIMNAVVDGIMASGFDGLIVVVSNPVDALSYYVYKRSGLPKAQVIGTGTALETARLKQLIGHQMKIDPRSVQAYVMGEHGDSMMVPWSHVQVGGKAIEDIMEDNPHRFKDMNLDLFVEMTANAGHEVLQRKGSTQFGIASATTGIISAVLRDENRMMTVSTLLDGEYGEKNIFCGVPTIIGKEGVVEIGVLRLTEEEKIKLKASTDIIRKSISG